MDEIIIDEAGSEITTGPHGVVRRDGGALPVPRVSGHEIRVRPGDLNDLRDVDSLQKRQSAELGFLQRKALEGKVENRELLVAETVPTHCRPAKFAGYVIGSDTYFKREEVGVVYQMAVEPAFRRMNVAGVLLQALFDSWPWGTRLCCAWCAQDLAANRFWEAMGFVPLAYRAGGGPRDAARVHIFWQKRVHVGDDSTPWWYPSTTGQGAMREDRLVLPIPEGQHWADARPQVLPELPATAKDAAIEADAVETDDPDVPDEELVGQKRWPEGIEEREGGLYQKGKRLMTHDMMRREQGSYPGGPFMVLPGTKLVGELPRPLPRRRRKARRVKRTHDPRLVSAVRDLRDRWLGHVNGHNRLLPSGERYAVGRPAALVAKDALVLPMPVAVPRRMLPAA